MGLFERKGFRTPNKKEQERLAMEADYKERATAFLADHRINVKKHRIDFKATLKPSDSALQSVLELTEAELEPEQEVKPWSEAMQENLDVRTACKHEDNEGNGVCTKCNLGKTNWGENGVGATEEYIKDQYAKIEKSKKREVSCNEGKHRLNEESEKGLKGAMEFCKYCRKAKAEMTEDEVANLLTEETDENK